MHIDLLDKLCCPLTQMPLHLKFENTLSINDISDNVLLTKCGQHSYNIINGIPRFVSISNYADNFGFQWNYFSKTQLDSYSGHPISSDRFWKATNWSVDEIKDKWILDVGCGSGRFAEVALKAGAKVVALDYSSAVDSCYDNLKHFPNLYVVQGDIFALPFKTESFDFVYSLGVLQHTPNVKKAFLSLPPMLKPGGHLCVDYYWKRFVTVLHSKYLIRPLTKQMDKNKLFTILKKNIIFLYNMSEFLRKIPLFGKFLMRFIPVANYTDIYPLTKEQILDWALLDTFDMLSPKYDYPQTKNTIFKWMLDANLQNIEISHQTLLVIRGRK